MLVRDLAADMAVDRIIAFAMGALTMKAASDLVAKQAKKPAGKRSHRQSAVARYSPTVERIVRLARKLKGAFGPT